MKKRLVGIGFYLVGIVFALFSKGFCGKICNYSCNNEQTSTCFFLFLFVSIILIVNASCFIMEKKD